MGLWDKCFVYIGYFDSEVFKKKLMSVSAFAIFIKLFWRKWLAVEPNLTCVSWFRYLVYTGYFAVKCLK